LALGFIVVAGCSSESVNGSGGGKGGSSGQGSGGSSATTGAGGSSSTTGAGGSSSTTGAGGGSSDCPTAPITCGGTVPQKTTLIDFSRYMASGAWGDSSMGDLTGGTSPYHGSGTDLTLAVEGTAPDATLHITGMVPFNDYAGFVLWFGPCTNANMVMDPTSGTTTPTTGIALTLGGNLAGSQLRFQVQTDVDYPVDTANSKGACLYNCDPSMSKWSQCVPPGSLMTTVPSAPALTNFLWGVFTGGMPNASTTGAGLVGLQFQFECGTSGGCNVDVQLGSIVLTQ
jgi:hypothetical protein